MPTYPNIESYYQELEGLIQFGGSDNELSIRAAFQNCLSEYCSNHRENLNLIPRAFRRFVVISAPCLCTTNPPIYHCRMLAYLVENNLNQELINRSNTTV